MGESVIIYSTKCPRCKVLENKLQAANIPYDEITDVEIMKSKGFQEAPKLEVDGVVMDFKEAVKWIGER